MGYRGPTWDDGATPEQVTADARSRLAAAGFPLRQDPRFDLHDHTRGSASCELCSRHDHDDVTPFGWTITEQVGTVNGKGREEPHQFRNRLPVPAWWFTCPAPGCADPIVAAMSCTRWTPAGARWRRMHPDQFPGQQPLLMDDDLEGAF